MGFLTCYPRSCSLCLASGLFCFSFVGNYIQTSANDLIISQLQAIFQLFTSYLEQQYRIVFTFATLSWVKMCITLQANMKQSPSRGAKIRYYILCLPWNALTVVNKIVFTCTSPEAMVEFSPEKNKTSVLLKNPFLFHLETYENLY